jgi:hypothetical protein
VSPVPSRNILIIFRRFSLFYCGKWAEHYKGIPRARRQDILGGKQIMVDNFDEVQQRSLKDYDDFEGGEF